jgi:hypothetical protein
VVKSRDGEGIATQNFQDIGSYTVFPDTYWRRMFPRKGFGKIEAEDYARNKTFGIMTREEGLRITNDLHRITTPEERSLPYQDMATWGIEQIKEDVLHDELKYTHLQQDLSLSLLDYIESFKEDDERNTLKHFFMPPGIFDGVVNILAQQLTKSPIRPHVCDPAARMALIH